MKQRHVITNSILWASAILCAAVLKAPLALTLVFLPCLAVISILVAPKLRNTGRCADKTL